MEGGILTNNNNNSRKFSPDGRSDHSYYLILLFSRFAFVEFDSITKAEEAFNNFNQTEVDGRLVYISYSNSGKGRGGGGKFGKSSL